MRDGFWDGMVHKRNYAIGIPKGLQVVLEERGIDISGMNGNKMREVLKSHPDFKNEKRKIERLLTDEHGHIAYFLLKYHCEINPIERVWAQLKNTLKPAAFTV